MKTKNEKLPLEEIHLKCIENLPDIIDLMIETGDRIAETFNNPYYKEITEILEVELKSKNGWKFKKKGRNTAKENIHSFEIKSKFELIKPIKDVEHSGIESSFSVSLGFYYENKLPVFHFSMDLDLDGKPINNYKYYSHIKEKNKNNKIKIIIHHPENPNNSADYLPEYPEESVKVFCHEPNMSLFDEMYDFYKVNILLPKLKNLK